MDERGSTMGLLVVAAAGGGAGAAGAAGVVCAAWLWEACDAAPPPSATVFRKLRRPVSLLFCILSRL